MVNVELFKIPVTEPYIITQTYEEHLQYAAEHPEITYNGGIDLYSDDSTIRAAFDGIVEKVAYQAGGYGNYAKVKHAWGYSIYAHLDRVNVNVGEKIPAGAHIGIMGTTGNSTGRHLHFEMRDLTERVLDPTEFFKTEQNLNSRSHLTAVVCEFGGNFRKTPLGDYITTIPKGTIGKVIGGPVYKYGLVCYEIEFPVRGWMAEKDITGTQILTGV